MASNYPLYAITLQLQKQKQFADFNWTTHAAVCFPQGWMPSATNKYLIETMPGAVGTAVPAQMETVESWPDGSIKWMHVHSNFKWKNGLPYYYAVSKPPTQTYDVPATPLKVKFSDGTEPVANAVYNTAKTLMVETGVINMQVSLPFAGISVQKTDGTSIVSGQGGPSFVDDRGILWHAMYDSKAEMVIEQMGPIQTTVRISGWYQSAEKRVAPICRFVTRITLAANSDLVKFDHATIFADDMDRYGIVEMGFKIPVANVSSYATAVDGTVVSETFNATVNNAWFAQFTHNSVMKATSGAVEPRLPNFTTSGSKCDGWFQLGTTAGAVALLTKDIWQKCPKEVKVSKDGFTFYTWPKHNELNAQVPEDLNVENIYKFRCFHKGQILEGKIPSDYFTALYKQTDTAECLPTYARAASMQGVAIRNQFALSCKLDQMPEYTAKLQGLYVDGPIATTHPVFAATSDAVGPSSSPSTGAYKGLDTLCENAVMGHAASTQRFEDYGMFIYGNTHHEQFMATKRPTLHRVWSNNHYSYVSTIWYLFFRNPANKDLLNVARMWTDNFTSIGQCRYDNKAGYLDGNGGFIVGAPLNKHHRPGVFWHCKGLVPWGGRDYGMDKNDVDADHIGHWVDPTGLKMAWILDADRWAKEGYELWLDNVVLPTTGTCRDRNNTIVHAIQAYQYRPNQTIMNAIIGMKNSLMAVDITKQHPGPIWEPTWLSQYYEMFPNDEAFKQFIIKSADDLGTSDEGIWSLALSATAWKITGNKNYLLRHAGTLHRMPKKLFKDATGVWDNYGVDPHPTRDGQFAKQWPRFLGALREAGVNSMPPVVENGTYFSSYSRYNYAPDIAARGAKVMIHQATVGTLSLILDGITLAGGDIGASSMWVNDPSGVKLLDIPRLKMASSPHTAVRALRPSSWQVLRESYNIPADSVGLYKVTYGAHEIGLFQGMSGKPECQVLRKVRTTYWPSEDTVFAAKVSNGYMVSRTTGPITLKFTGVGTHDGAHVMLKDKNNSVLLDAYLKPSEVATVTLDGTMGPWFFDGHAEQSGYFKMHIDATVNEPLFYGASLTDIQTISNLYV